VSATAGEQLLQADLTAAEVLQQLAQRDVEVWAEGDRLRYRAPAGQLSADLKELLARRKSELLAWLRERQPAPAGASVPRITPAPAERYEPFPLTDLQQAYWVGRSGAFELGNVGSHFYLEADLPGLDLGRFNQALVRLIERHDMLRAVVRPDGRQQVLSTVPPYRVAVVDLTGCSPERAAAARAAVRAEMSHQVLPADRWPLFGIRASLVAGGGVRLHMSFDLLIGDVWSFQIFFRELFTLYRRPATVLPALALSFRDYVLAEAAFQGSARYRQSHEYWRGRLGSLPPPPELPLARTAAELDRPRFTRRSGRLEAGSWRRLKQRATRAGITPSAVLLAAFAEVLATWSKSRRFTLNLTFFNRLPFHPQINDLMGDFSATLLLAVEEGADSFGARAQALQQQLWRDLENVHVSGVRVLRELARARRERAAAMPVVFTSALHAGAGEAEAGVGEESWQPVYGISQTPQVWLDHRVTEQAGALTYSWDVVEELFPAGLMDAMFAAYRGLLDRLAADDGAWETASLGLVPDEQLALIAAANATAAPLPAGLLHQGFLAQAARAPERPAVIAGEHCLSYGELAWRSRGLGRRLRRLGVRPNQLVAVVMEKGWEQVVAVVGVLESGAAYLPIDAGLPRARVWHLLERGEVAQVVTQPWLASGLEWPPGIEVLAVGPRAAAAAAEGEEPEVPAAAAWEEAQQPEDLAYVIFTSGSTGEPKGVMVDHRGALNTVADVNRRFGVGGGDRVLALSSLSFDLSVYDLFGPLSVGGAVVVPEGGPRQPERWSQALASGVTVWNSVPALMELLVEHLEGRGEPAGSLRLVLLSGDWIPVQLPERIRRHWPGVEVISLGGATEASIWSILHPIERVEEGWKSIPYGRAMVNQSFQVLDERLAPRPLWVAGSLYIGGAGLARGYWRDEEKTAASFVRHPHSGERLYRTGDLGRWLPQGEIEFLGREDLQVKVQGHRIELGEIEAALAQHPAVRAVAVKAVGERQGAKRLVAYVVPAAAPPAAEDLGAYLRAALPAYMVPAVFVTLAELPRTASGKVDRAALPEPPAAAPPAAAPAAPGSPLAERIAALAAAVLGVERVDPNTPLMDLGAISVDMIRIANQLDKELGFRPRVEDLYRQQTCAAVAAAIILPDGPPAAAAPVPDAARGLSAGAAGAAGSAWTSSDLLLDPAEREAFKRRQPGVRAIAAADLRLELPPAPAAAAAFALRRSCRQYGTAPLPLAALGGLLSCLRQLGAGAEARYLYPSAGGVYPVQAYLHVKAGRVEELRAGTYYYHPVEHRLVQLVGEATIERSVHAELINRPVFDQAAFSLFLVAEAAAMAPLYGRGGRDFCLIEAGAMLQLLMTAATAHGLGICPIGSLDFAPLRPLLGLGPSHELMHSLLGGTRRDDEGPGRRAGWVDAPLAAAADSVATPASAPGTAPPLARRSRLPGEPLPLSFGQHQLWFLHQLDPESHHYNSPVAVRLSGELQAPALQRTLAEVVRRHEALRTVFSAVDGRPAQIVARPAPITLPLIDLSGLPAALAEAEARLLVTAEVRRPFDLARGPVARFRLLRLRGDEHVAAVTVHHIASDFWSLGILVREVAALYEAFSAGRPSPLPELPLQYADFAAWQREWLRGDRLGSQIAGWRRRLAGARPAMALPADFPRPPVQRFRGASHARRLAAQLATRIKQVGRAEGATPFMTLLAALMALLHGATGETDLLVGSPVANRNHADVEGLIGLFVNLLVFRVDLQGDPSFRELLRRVRDVALDAQAHQDLPFGLLVEELRPERNLAHTPIFQVAYTYQDARRTSFDLPRLRMTPLGVETGTTQFDLILNVEDAAEGLTLALEYNTDLFEGATIQRLLAGMEELLGAVAARPDTSLGDLRELAAGAEARWRAAARRELETLRQESIKTVRRKALTPAAVPRQEDRRP